jgi:hypothetical protein
MRKNAILPIVLAAALALPFLACRKGPLPDSRDAVFRIFSDPPPDYRSVPLWVWNDRIINSQIEEQLADFKAQGIGGVFVHPRPGLITPYLSEEWLSLFRHAVDTGRSLGMKVWIYDENSYPSGFAGGYVPAAKPDAARAGLRMARTNGFRPGPGKEPLLVLRRTESGFEDVTVKANSGGTPKDDLYIFDVVKDGPSPWYGGFTYVDVMRRDVTEKFLDITYDAYQKAAGGEFGRVVPGAFQDEAEIAPAGDADCVNYTPALFDAFRVKWGYDLKVQLPSLFEETGDWRKVRHDYYAALLELFIGNWAKPYYDFCSANKLTFTGHYWEHDWPIPGTSPDSMGMSAYAHMPGIDILMNSFESGPHAQFGNARAVREVRSVANQLGRERTLSETFGASGWDLTFFDQKRIGDWEYALGVNFLNQHLSYVTIKGARKRDHPLSFSYHEPWWKAYRVLADYFARLSAVMSIGRQVNRVLVLEPTTTAWMHYSPSGPNDRLEAIGREFQDFIHSLEAGQVEYDLASEAILKDHGQVQASEFVVGEGAYALIVFPPGLENLEGATVGLLKDYLDRGGKVLSWVEAPRFVDGRPTDEVGKLASSSRGWTSVPVGSGLEKIGGICPSKVVFEGLDASLLFHHRRELADGNIVFLANTSPDHEAGGRFRLEGRSVELWNPFTGGVSAYPFEKEGRSALVSFAIPAGGSLLLFVGHGKSEALRPGVAGKTGTGMTAGGAVLIERESPNVLTLDYCDLNMGGRTEKDLYFYDAQKMTFQRHGFDRNPWDSSVQYKTNILDKDKFASDSGFEAAFTFEAAKGVNLSSLQAVVERPELFTVLVNGREVKPLPDRWWLDKAFGVFAVGKETKDGRNTVVLRARPFTIHTELEPIYILGDFALECVDKGFRLVPAAPLAPGAWSGQGLPFYSGAVRYTKTFEVPEKTPESRYVLALGSWNGAVAEVRVGERTAGYIAFKPFELDITDALAPGANEVSVAVYGTLKNTLGPHHNGQPLGRAWPWSFQQGAKGGRPPGSEYGVIGYGLFGGFELAKRTVE